MRNDSILKVHQLTMSYGHKDALRDVSFSINEGTVTGVIGANGCGKTTLFKVLSGLIQDFKGELLVCGHDDTWEVKSDVCYHPTLPFYQPRMSINSAIRQQALLYENFNADIANSLYQKFGFQRSEQLGQLSRGRCALSLLILSLSIDARIYFLDEPFSGIDLKSRSQMKEVLLNASAQGKTLLVATHEIYEMEDLFDYVLFMKDGSLIMHRTADEIREMFGGSVAEAAKELI